MKVLFFGILSEKLKQREIEFKEETTLFELKSILYTKFPVLKSYPHLIAVNQEITHEDQNLNPGDEIALLPPYAGG